MKTKREPGSTKAVRGPVDERESRVQVWSVSARQMGHSSGWGTEFEWQWQWRHSGALCVKWVSQVEGQQSVVVGADTKDSERYKRE